MATMCIYLIGVKHEYPYEDYSSGSIEFHSFLRRLANDKCVDLMAEELSEEAISLRREALRREAVGSVASNVASELRIRHKLCDPDSSQREQLGIKSGGKIALELALGREGTSDLSDLGPEVEAVKRKDWPKREAYWLDRILEEDFERCIFILGAGHVETFCRSLDREQVEYEIVAKDWHPSHNPEANACAFRSSVLES